MVSIVMLFDLERGRINTHTDIFLAHQLRLDLHLANVRSQLDIGFTLLFFSIQVIVEFRPPLNSLVSIVKGEKWRHIRNTLSPSFSALKMKRMVPLMNQACDTFMTKLEKVADHEKSVDIHE